MKVLAGFPAHKGYQIASVRKSARHIVVWQIAAQCHQMAHAHGLQGVQMGTHRVLRRMDAGEVRRSAFTFTRQLGHGAQAALLGGASGPVGHGAKTGM